MLKIRIHLDLVATRFKQGSARLVGLGATRLRDLTADGRVRWTTFADP